MRETATNHIQFTHLDASDARFRRSLGSLPQFRGGDVKSETFLVDTLAQRQQSSWEVQLPQTQKLPPHEAAEDEKPTAVTRELGERFVAIIDSPIILRIRHTLDRVGANEEEDPRKQSRLVTKSRRPSHPDSLLGAELLHPPANIGRAQGWLINVVDRDLEIDRLPGPLTGEFGDPPMSLVEWIKSPREKRTNIGTIHKLFGPGNPDGNFSPIY